MPNRRYWFALLGVLVVTAPIVSTAAEQDAWSIWEKELHRRCPANHVDWISGGAYDEVLGGFTRTLPLSTQRRIAAIADYSHRCSEETAGFHCEMAVHLDAFNRLGLMKRFVAFMCRQYICSEPALCTKISRNQDRCSLAISAER